MDIPDLRSSISLAHLRRLTDSFGIIQHADFALPDYRSGYTTDDNARALAVAAHHYLLFRDAPSLELAETYLAFLHYAQREDGRFHNFFGFDRKPCDEVGSEDSLARTLSALAYTLFAPPEPNMVGPTERLFYTSLRWIPRLEHIRSKAGCILAMYSWWQGRPYQRDEAAGIAKQLADFLVAQYHEYSRPDWEWFLPEMTYANALLPEALFRAAQITDEKTYQVVASRTLDFLCEKTFCEGRLKLVGNYGWYNHQDIDPAEFDQQPIDAAAMVAAALAAFDATGQAVYLRRAWHALSWFFGGNAHGLPLYDASTGGCFDGLTKEGVNFNRGAESTLALLQAQLTMFEARQKYFLTTLATEESSLMQRDLPEHTSSYTSDAASRCQR